jgi:hypothetical protein
MLEPEIAALDDGAVDHLGVFVEPYPSAEDRG